MPNHGYEGKNAAAGEHEQVFRTARSKNELHTLIHQEGVKAAIYEAPKFRHAEVLIKHRDLLDRVLMTCFGELKGKNGTDSHSFNHILITARELITTNPTLSLDEVQRLHVAIEAVLADMQEILLPFRDYKIRYISVKQADDMTALRNQDWHTDTGAGKLHVVRVYSGPSTEYALGGNVLKSVTFKDGAISVHDERAIHRAPYYSDSKPRFAIVIRLDRA